MSQRSKESNENNTVRNCNMPLVTMHRDQEKQSRKLFLQPTMEMFMRKIMFCTSFRVTMEFILKL